MAKTESLGRCMWSNYEDYDRFRVPHIVNGYKGFACLVV